MSEEHSNDDRSQPESDGTELYSLTYDSSHGDVHLELEQRIIEHLRR